MKEIKGYEGLYSVTENGQIWSERSKKFLVSTPNSQGYLLVTLSKQGERKKYRVHRLVLQTFCPVDNMENLQVNHKDENKQNNCLSNLEWSNSSANNNYGSRLSRISSTLRNKVEEGFALCGKNAPVKCQCVETGVIYNSLNEAERKTGIGSANIHRAILNYKYGHTAGGFHWKKVG